MKPRFMLFSGPFVHDWARRVAKTPALQCQCQTTVFSAHPPLNSAWMARYLVPAAAPRSLEYQFSPRVLPVDGVVYSRKNDAAAPAAYTPKQFADPWMRNPSPNHVGPFYSLGMKIRSPECAGFP